MIESYITMMHSSILKYARKHQQSRGFLIYINIIKVILVSFLIGDFALKKVIVEKGCGQNSDAVALISQFCIFAEEDLNLGDLSYGVLLTGDKEKHGIKTTAYFNPNTNDVVIFTMGRHPHDICRSIAHEMVHMRQAKHNFFGRDNIKDVGGFFEDEANSVAGQIVKKFIAYR
jgi:hypothetical protein